MTDVLAVIIDYGLSTVDAANLYSDIYPYDQLVSLISNTVIYESKSGPENDIVELILHLDSMLNTIYDSEDPTIIGMNTDFLRILYILYTGQELPTEVNADVYFRTYADKVRDSALKHGATSNTTLTHPDIKYDPYGAVINFCNRYSKIYTVSEYNASLYNSILDTGKDKQMLNTIVDTRQLYWYQKYTSALNTINIDMQSIEDNDWYRTAVINPIIRLPLISRYNINADVIVSIFSASPAHIREASLIIVSIYRYILYYSQYHLNISPFQYSDPHDILSALGQVLNDPYLQTVR